MDIGSSSPPVVKVVLAVAAGRKGGGMESTRIFVTAIHGCCV
jgi:hypothetical protein